MAASGSCSARRAVCPSHHFDLIERATGRCPGDARLRLALAVASDQRLAQRRAGARLAFDRAAGAGPDASRVMNPVTTEEERRVLSLYDAAAGSPETRHEAKVRAAWLHLRTGRYTDGLALLDGLTDPPADRHVRYLGELAQGQLLLSLGRSDAAAEAFRAALVTWPDAQAARVALMTLLVDRGEMEEAFAIAEAVQTSTATALDPWWLYWLGDFREYSDLRSKLREAAR